MIKYGQLFCLLCGKRLKDADNGMCKHSTMLEGLEDYESPHLPSHPSTIQNLLQASLAALMLERRDYPHYDWPKILADEMCWALKVLANADNKDEHWNLNGPVHPDDMEDE